LNGIKIESTSEQLAQRRSFTITEQCATYNMESIWKLLAIACLALQVVGANSSLELVPTFDADHFL
jgi:hypothetical protein